MKTINKIFLKKRYLPLNIYLEKVLYDKEIGYYQKQQPFGPKGDFITAPNISNIFCEMIAIWLVSFWENLDKPKKINFVELGPGNGDLCSVLIDSLKNFPEANSAIKIHLYEKSKRLIKLQKTRISKKKVIWIKNLKEINDGPVIFFGNEFLDALPIKQFIKRNKVIFEKYVSLKNNKIGFLYKKASRKNITKLKVYDLFKKNNFVEFPEQGFKELDVICKMIRKYNGGCLFIDYGYINKNNSNTLQSIKSHKYNDITKNIGNADITSLVDFSLYKKYFDINGLQVENVITQSEFLQKLGMLERAKILSKNMNKKEKKDLFFRLQRLIDVKFMGEQFKVIFSKNKKCNFSLAFK